MSSSIDAPTAAGDTISAKLADFDAHFQKLDAHLQTLPLTDVQKLLQSFYNSCATTVRFLSPKTDPFVQLKNPHEGHRALLRAIFMSTQQHPFVRASVVSASPHEIAFLKTTTNPHLWMSWALHGFRANTGTIDPLPITGQSQRPAPDALFLERNAQLRRCAYLAKVLLDAHTQQDSHTKALNAFGSLVYRRVRTFINGPSTSNTTASAFSHALVGPLTRWNQKRLGLYLLATGAALGLGSTGVMGIAQSLAPHMHTLIHASTSAVGVGMVGLVSAGFISRSTAKVLPWQRKIIRTLKGIYPWLDHMPTQQLHNLLPLSDMLTGRSTSDVFSTLFFPMIFGPSINQNDKDNHLLMQHIAPVQPQFFAQAYAHALGNAHNMSSLNYTQIKGLDLSASTQWEHSVFEDLPTPLQQAFEALSPKHSNYQSVQAPRLQDDLSARITQHFTRQMLHMHSGSLHAFLNSFFEQQHLNALFEHSESNSTATASTKPKRKTL